MRSSNKRLGVLTAAALVPVLLAGCPNRPINKVDPERVGETNNPFIQNLNRDIDILFVIDNSGSMALEQSALATKLPDFINVLAALPGGLPNVHIGVVSSNMGAGTFSLQSCETANGDRGVLQNSPKVAGCMPPQGRFIKDIDSPTGRVRNYTGNLSDVFSCIGRLGIDGCGFEHHLGSMKAALDGSANENADFLRPNAFLAVIILADEDDCTSKAPGAMFNPADNSVQSPLGPLTSFRCFEFGITCNPSLARTQPGPRSNCVSNETSQYVEPVQKYVDFLISLKNGAKNKVIVASIIGNPSPVEVGTDNMMNPLLLPSCESAQGQAVPGIRLETFTKAFGDNGSVISICQNDFSPALRRIGELIAAALGKQCIRAPLVNVPASDPSGTEVVGGDGKRVSCTVTDTLNLGTDTQVENPLPVCDGSRKPCWKPVFNPTECPTQVSPDNLELSIERDGPPEGDVTAVVRCLSKQ
ncbi:MAG: VWA domain-containing protein [Deltaproteobacteria bacterium]|nr:VWA domain-containing protein [Deltaproteobacteria bacterium]